MQSALERAMAELAFGPALDIDDRQAVADWLERSGLSATDRDALMDSDLSRLFVYRDLIRGTLFGALEVTLPRVVARLDLVLVEYFDRFLAERGPRTHYLRDVVSEFLDYCQPLWVEDERVPAFMIQLARHENVQIEVGAMETGPGGVVQAELSLDQPVLFIEAVRLMRYDFAIHQLSDDPGDASEPAPEATALLVYRSPEHEVRYLALSPLAAEILQRLLAGEALGSAVQGACSSLDQALDPGVLEGTAQLLADLAERGALLGSPGTDTVTG